MLKKPVILIVFFLGLTSFNNSLNANTDIPVKKQQEEIEKLIHEDIKLSFPILKELEKETTLIVVNYEDLLKATLISKQTNDINSLHDIWSIHSYQGKKSLYITPKKLPKELKDKHELGGYLFYRIPDGTNMKVILGKTEKGWEIVNMEKRKSKLEL